MESTDLELNQLGVATFLIDKLALRVGNEKGEDEADTVGCCSLRVEHISLDEGENKIKFDFLGKDSMRYLKVVDVPDIVYKRMKQFTYHGKLSEETKKDPKEDLFDRINATRLNEHLKTHMSDLSAKVFRTYNASSTLQRLLDKSDESGIKEKSTTEEKTAFYNKCNREVAILCNHKKAESKNLKDQLDRIQSKINEKKAELKTLMAQAKKLKAGVSDVESTATTSQAGGPAKKAEVLKGRIQKLKQMIASKELELTEKKENAEVALGTSKINYMDPRISITWCKKMETPIEKVFPKTLRSKFAWAMDTEPQWNF